MEFLEDVWVRIKADLSDLVAGLSGGAKELDSFKGNIDNFANSTNSLKEAMESAAQKAEENAQRLSTAYHQAFTQSGDDINKYIEAMGKFTPGADALVQKQKELDTQLVIARGNLVEIQMAYESGAVSLNTLVRAQEAAEEASRKANVAFQEQKPPIEDLEGGMKSLAESFLKFGEALAITEGLKEFAHEAMEAADNVTRSGIAFTVMTKDAGASKEIIEQLEKLGIADGLSFPALLSAGQRMARFLGDAENVPAILAKVADGAAAANTSIEAAANAFDRVAQMGTLSMRVLMPLGLSIKDIASAMGVTAEQAKTLFRAMSETERIDVLSDALDKLKGIAQKTREETFGGAWASLAVQWEGVMKEAGNAMMPLTHELTTFLSIQVVPMVKELAVGFNTLSPVVKDTAVAFAAIAGTAGPAALAFGGFALAMHALGVEITFAGVAATALEAIPWVGMAAIAAAEAKAVLDVVAAQKGAADAEDIAEAAASRLAKSLAAQGKDVTDLTAAHALHNLTLEQYVAELAKVSKELGSHVKASTASEESAKRLSEFLERQGKDVSALTEEHKKGNLSLDDYVKKLDAVAKSLGLNADAHKYTAAQLLLQIKGLADAKAAMDEYSAAYQKAFSLLGLVSESTKVRDLEAAYKLLASSGRLSLDELTAAHEALDKKMLNVVEHTAAFSEELTSARAQLTAVKLAVDAGGASLIQLGAHQDDVNKKFYEANAALESYIALMKQKQAVDYQEKTVRDALVKQLDAENVSYGKAFVQLKQIVDMGANYRKHLSDTRDEMAKATDATGEYTAAAKAMADWLTDDVPFATFDNYINTSKTTVQQFTEYMQQNAAKMKTLSPLQAAEFVKEAEILFHYFPQVNEVIITNAAKWNQLKDTVVGTSAILKSEGVTSFEALNQVLGNAKTNLEQVEKNFKKHAASIQDVVLANERYHYALLQVTKAQHDLNGESQADIQLQIQIKEVTGQSATVEIKRLTDLQIQTKILADQSTLLGNVYRDLMKIWSDAFGQLSKAIADNIVDAKNWGDVFMGVLQTIEKEILNVLIGTVFKALGDAIEKNTHLMQGMSTAIQHGVGALGSLLHLPGFGKSSGSAGAGGGEPNPGNALPGGDNQVGSDVGSGEVTGPSGSSNSGSSSSGSSAGGLLGTLGGIAPIVGAIAAVGSGIAQGLQMARLINLTSEIEISTRQTKEQLVGGIQTALNTWLPKLADFLGIWTSVDKIKDILWWGIVNVHLVDPNNAGGGTTSTNDTSPLDLLTGADHTWAQHQLDLSNAAQQTVDASGNFIDATKQATAGSTELADTTNTAANSVKQFSNGTTLLVSDLVDAHARLFDLLSTPSPWTGQAPSNALGSGDQAIFDLITQAFTKGTGQLADLYASNPLQSSGAMNATGGNETASKKALLDQVNQGLSPRGLIDPQGFGKLFLENQISLADYQKQAADFVVEQLKQNIAVNRTAPTLPQGQDMTYLNATSPHPGPSPSFAFSDLPIPAYTSQQIQDAATQYRAALQQAANALEQQRAVSNQLIDATQLGISQVQDRLKFAGSGGAGYRSTAEFDSPPVSTQQFQDWMTQYTALDKHYEAFGNGQSYYDSSQQSRDLQALRMGPVHSMSAPPINVEAGVQAYTKALQNQMINGGQTFNDALGQFFDNGGSRIPKIPNYGGQLNSLLSSPSAQSSLRDSSLVSNSATAVGPFTFIVQSEDAANEFISTLESYGVRVKG